LAADWRQESGRPLKLVIPDGTWGQTQRMLKRIDALRGMRCVELPEAWGAASTRNRPRLNVKAERVSTFEAAAHALSLIEDKPAIEPPLLDFFQRAADRMLWLRGRLTAAEVYGGLPSFSRAEDLETIPCSP
jgi:DTW domain-containing protein YfiP